MTIQHSALTDPNLHEPKGASTAANGSVYISNGAGSGAWSLLSAITDPLLPEPKDIATANSGDVYIANGVGGGVWTPLASSSFTETFVSGSEFITSGGNTVLPHLLSGAPFEWTMHLQCTIAEHGYAAGEIIKPIGLASSTGGLNKGCTIAADGTNLDIRYGSDPNTFNVSHKTTGNDEEITNGNWRAIFKAWR
jgi:hypothetical protein